MPLLPPSAGGAAPDNTKAYSSQTDQIFKIPGRDDGSGNGAFFYIGDDNQPSQSTMKFGTQVILPLVFPTSTSMTLTWLAGAWFDGTAYSPFKLDTVAPTVSGAPAAATGLALAGGVFSWTNNTGSNPIAIYLDYSTSPTFASVARSEVISIGTASPPSSYTPIIAASLGYYRIRTVNANGTSNSAALNTGSGTSASGNSVMLIYWPLF